MKKYLLHALLAAFVAFGVSGCSMHSNVTKDVSNLPAYEKNGFLTTKWCAERDYFKDCPLETYLCGSKDCWKDYEAGSEEKTGNIVLYVHAERDYYNVEFKKPLKIYELEKEGFGRNDVTLKGYYDEKTKTIIANDFDAPPPPAKEFYKGCL
jgi:hypothetical protein